MSDEDIRKLQSRFYREREIISVPLNKVYDQVKHFRNSETEVRMKSHFAPTFLGDPVSGDIPQYFNGRDLRTTSRDMLYLAGDVGVGILNSNVAPGEVGSIWEVHAILADFQCDANAANRDCELMFLHGMDVAAAQLDDMWPTGVLVLTANQRGSIYVSGRGFIVIDTNGAIAYSATYESMLPAYVNLNGAIQADITANAQVGDTQGISIIYREVGSTV